MEIDSLSLGEEVASALKAGQAVSVKVTRSEIAESSHGHRPRRW